MRMRSEKKMAIGMAILGGVNLLNIILFYNQILYINSDGIGSTFEYYLIISLFGSLYFFWKNKKLQNVIETKVEKASNGYVLCSILYVVPILGSILSFIYFIISEIDSELYMNLYFYTIRLDPLLIYLSASIAWFIAKTTEFLSAKEIFVKILIFSGIPLLIILLSHFLPLIGIALFHA